MELWKRKRLLEMRRVMLEKEIQKEKPKKDIEEKDPEKVLKKLFVGRAWEVFHAAERQYPAIAQKVKEAFVQLFLQGNSRDRSLESSCSGSLEIWGWM